MLGIVDGEYSSASGSTKQSTCLHSIAGALSTAARLEVQLMVELMVEWGGWLTVQPAEGALIAQLSNHCSRAPDWQRSRERDRWRRWPPAGSTEQSTWTA